MSNYAPEMVPWLLRFTSLRASQTDNNRASSSPTATRPPTSPRSTCPLSTTPNPRSVSFCTKRKVRHVDCNKRPYPLRPPMYLVRAPSDRRHLALHALVDAPPPRRDVLPVLPLGLFHPPVVPHDLPRQCRAAAEHRQAPALRGRHAARTEAAQTETTPILAAGRVAPRHVGHFRARGAHIRHHRRLLAGGRVLCRWIHNVHVGRFALSEDQEGRLDADRRWVPFLWGLIQVIVLVISCVPSYHRARRTG